MSTRPYATHGGLRIRQCYNQRVIEYGLRTRSKVRPGYAPVGATGPEWDKWVLWTRAWDAALMANRDMLIAKAEQQAKEQRNERRNANRRG